MKSPAPLVVNKSSRYARRFSSVEGTLMLFNRFSMVPELSSAARIPLPGATSFCATDSRVSVFIIFYELGVEVGVDHIFSFSESQRIFDKIDAVDCQCGIKNLLWKALGSDKLRAMKLPARLLLAVLMLSIGFL